MRRRIRILGMVAALLAVAVVAEAQEPGQPPSGPVFPNALPPPAPPEAVAPGNPAEPTNPYERGLEGESRPAENEEDLATGRVVPRFGATPVSDVNFLMDYLRIRESVRRHRLPDVRLGRGRIHRRLDGHGPALRPAAAEPLRQRIPAQPDRLGPPEAPGARIGSTSGSTCGISPVPTRRLGQPKGGIGSTIDSHALQPGLPRPLPLGPPADPHRAGHGRQDRPHEHDHRV